ncbi:GAF domain-containing protein [Collimonas pratensis]|uniref:GAF domain protein n=1 Tax=Collimonas pratensis TaxID=279113 RepID=A0ABN4M4L8_9BURK|nr:GAF domain-containing protein [Collimonas pratensis]AMP12583.1 GAF domain protein [Collimonas pratensis]NKI71124.1 GAF domain-containing protein [Collimonas pratensis]
MFTSSTAEIDVDYALLARQAASILDNERDQNSNAAQFSAFVYQTIADLNWVGFYWVRPRGVASTHGDEQELLVGPFQGKVACARIQFGRGVCGAAAISREAVLVPDVHAFPGHIACDAASNAEIVIPVLKDGKLYGVFDIDSPSLNRFRPQDLQGLEALLAVFVAATDFE